MKTREKVFITGHKNPDTDSICSAIAYAELKRHLEDKEFTACRAGDINEETQFVLHRFGVESPVLFKDAATEVAEIEIHAIQGVDHETSVKQAWNTMGKQNVVTMPIVREDGTLEGLITVSDIAKSYMDIHDSDILSQANTSFASIAETLDGEIVVGNGEDRFDKGRVVVGAFGTETMGHFIREHDLVIMGDRTEDMIVAMEQNVAGIVVGLDAKISDLIIRLAREQGCILIRSPHDTYTNARLINQSLPVRHLMTSKNIVEFHLTDRVSEIRDIMRNLRHRDFPVLDDKEKYVGTISRRNLIGCSGKKLILVDHNERSQAVDHVEEAEILEIIDHHRLGSLETIGPILFRNEPVGCTATIIYRMYQEKDVEVPRPIAGLLCSAILSDTLIFHSPTCTERDRQAAIELAGIAGIQDIVSYAKEMFRAGGDLGQKTPQEILFQDFKRFNHGKMAFGVGQISLLDEEELAEIRTEMLNYLKDRFSELKLEQVYFLLTNIQEQSSEVLFCGQDARDVLEKAFDTEIEGDSVVLPNVVSRKKQFIPPMMTALQEQD
ncbi:MAG: putative manganese-dependent inorganic diphosphatase [Eubacterium sp.]|nr:putative manganese-dependent inorganic diphosphatase [Eubacterium sp.]